MKFVLKLFDKFIDSYAFRKGSSRVFKKTLKDFVKYIWKYPLCIFWSMLLGKGVQIYVKSTSLKVLSAEISKIFHNSFFLEKSAKANSKYQMLLFSSIRKFCWIAFQKELFRSVKRSYYLEKSRVICTVSHFLVKLHIAGLQLYYKWRLLYSGSYLLVKQYGCVYSSLIDCLLLVL